MKTKMKRKCSITYLTKLVSSLAKTNSLIGRKLKFSSLTALIHLPLDKLINLSIKSFNKKIYYFNRL